MRRYIAVTGTVVLLLTTGALAYAATVYHYHFSSGHGQVNHVAYMWRGSIGSANSTTSDSWSRFPMVPPGLHHPVPEVVTISTTGPVTATLSVSVNGAPAAFRVV